MGPYRDYRDPDEHTPEAKEMLPEIPDTWRPSQETLDALTGQEKSSRDWRTRDIQEVPLEEIDLDSSYVDGPEDFKKVPYDEMVDGFHKLEEVVRPAVEQGADGEYFSQLDAEKGLDYQHGYRRVYDAFYGQDAICLEKRGDTYHVINGYHRLYVAKRLGLSSVPARVL